MEISLLEDFSPCIIGLSRLTRTSLTNQLLQYVMGELSVFEYTVYLVYEYTYNCSLFQQIHLTFCCWSLHRFDPRSFRWAQTMRLAVEEINQTPNLLPNFTLGYKIYDSCATHVAAQRTVLAVLNGPSKFNPAPCVGASRLLAVVGDSGSSQSIVVSRTLQPFGIPMVCITYATKYYIMPLYEMDC